MGRNAQCFFYFSYLVDKLLIWRALADEFTIGNSSLEILTLMLINNHMKQYKALSIFVFFNAVNNEIESALSGVIGVLLFEVIERIDRF